MHEAKDIYQKVIRDVFVKRYLHHHHFLRTSNMLWEIEMYHILTSNPNAKGWSHTG